MYLKIIEGGALAAYGLCVFAGKSLAATGVPSWISDGGLVALVGFMIIQNYRQQRTMGKIISQKDDLLAEQTEALKDIAVKDIESRNNLTQVLKLKPCLKDKDVEL